MTSINTNNSIRNNVNINVNNNVKNSNKPSFGAQNTQNNKGISQEAAEALKAQRISQPTIPHITEKDINFEVTCVGHSNVKGNTRDVYDYRSPMSLHMAITGIKIFSNPTFCAIVILMKE